MSDVSTETPIRIGLDGRILMHYEMRSFARYARAIKEVGREYRLKTKHFLALFGKIATSFFPN